MAHTLITVDDIVVLDEILNEWNPQPPAALEALGKPVDPQPWHKACMIVLAEALMLSKPVQINIRTHTTGWNMNITHEQ